MCPALLLRVVCTELGLGRILEMDGADRARVELTCVNVRVNL